MKMIDTYNATLPRRTTLKEFFLWLAEHDPRLGICERTPTAGWLPLTETADELLDRYLGIDRHQLTAERLALQHDADACPCERDPAAP